VTATTFRRQASTAGTDAAALGALVVVGAVLWAGAMGARALPERVYREAVIAAGAPEHLLSVVVLVAVPILLSLRLNLGWRSRPLRTSTVLICLPLAWAFAAYAGNPYFGQAHLLDRLVVLLLVVAVWRHPAAIGAFVWLISAIGGQLSHPIGGYTWVDKELLIAVLCVVLAGALLATVLPRTQAVLPLVVAGTVCAPYVRAGVAKLALRWQDEDLGNLFASSHVNGWLGSLDPSTVESVANRIESLSPALAVATVLVELAAVLVVWSRKAVVPVLALLATLHLSIYLASGIFFWKWLVLLVAVGLLLRGDAMAEAWGWQRQRRLAILGAALVASIVVHQPSTLAWRDTELTQAFDIEVVLDDGSVHTVPRLDLEPYDTLFAQNRLFPVTDLPRVVGTYGTVGTAELADEISEASVDDLAGLKARHGRSVESREFAAGLDALLRALVVGDRPGRLPLLPSPPHHIQSQGDDGWRDGAPVEVRVRLREVLLVDGRLETITNRIVRRIPLDGSTTDQP
jgi:hypothetical protein